MAARTVRLDEDSEKILETLASEMGLSVSAVLKKGLLGPGGYALAPSTETRRGVPEALRRRRR